MYSSSERLHLLLSFTKAENKTYHVWEIVVYFCSLVCGLIKTWTCTSNKPIQIEIYELRNGSIQACVKCQEMLQTLKIFIVRWTWIHLGLCLQWHPGRCSVICLNHSNCCSSTFNGSVTMIHRPIFATNHRNTTKIIWGLKKNVLTFAMSSHFRLPFLLAKIKQDRH